MDKIDAFGNSSNNFTDGDPATNTPATVVDAKWLNNVQSELVNIVESSGIVLDPADKFQAFKAIQSLIQNGGAQNLTTITNNAGPLDVVGAQFRNTLYQSISIKFDLRRRDDTDQFRELGEIILLWDYETSGWDTDLIVNYFKGQGDSGVTFSVADFNDGSFDFAKIKYTADDMAGANYLAELKILSISTTKK